VNLTDGPITGSGRHSPKKLAYLKQDLCLIFLSLDFDDLILDSISNPIRWPERSSSHEPVSEATSEMAVFRL
jgi:hypothetical protein